MKSSFTIIELLVIIGILTILTALAVPAFRVFQKESDLNNSVEEIINTLRLAQSKTLASEGASNYGVHFETEKYVLFRGTNYDSGAAGNEIHKLPKAAEIYEINLAGGGSEVVFRRVTGETDQSGKVYLRLKSNPSKTRTISIGSFGQIWLE